MTQGVLNELKDNKHCDLEWIIVPMICVDGVILGNTRTGINGIDLNRYWCNEEIAKREKILPEIIAVINLVKFIKKTQPKKPKLFLDLHGHSSQPNIFTYGPPL